MMVPNLDGSRLDLSVANPEFDMFLDARSLHLAEKKPQSRFTHPILVCSAMALHKISIM
jgi:hypothetical protein